MRSCCNWRASSEDSKPKIKKREKLGISKKSLMIVLAFGIWKNNNNTINNYSPHIQYRHTNRLLQYKIPYPQYISNIQIHSLQPTFMCRGPLRECRSIWSGASWLLYYCAPLVCVSEVIELLDVWRHNKPKTKNQKPNRVIGVAPRRVRKIN